MPNHNSLPSASSRELAVIEPAEVMQAPESELATRPNVEVATQRVAEVIDVTDFSVSYDDAPKANTDPFKVDNTAHEVIEQDEVVATETGFATASAVAEQQAANTQASPVDTNRNANRLNKTADFLDKASGVARNFAERMNSGETATDIAKSYLGKAGRSAARYAIKRASQAGRNTLNNVIDNAIDATLADKEKIDNAINAAKNLASNAKQRYADRQRRRAIAQTEAMLASQTEAARENDHEAAFKDPEYMAKLQTEASSDSGYVNKIQAEAYKDSGYMDTVHAEALKDNSYMDMLHDEASAEYQEVLAQRKEAEKKARAARIKKIQRRAKYEAIKNGAIDKTSETWQKAAGNTKRFGKTIAGFVKNAAKKTVAYGQGVGTAVKAIHDAGMESARAVNSGDNNLSVESAKAVADNPIPTFETPITKGIPEIDASKLAVKVEMPSIANQNIATREQSMAEIAQ